MSVQINFFADAFDSKELHQFLMDTISPLYVICADRGELSELAPIRAEDDSLLNGKRKIFLASKWALQFLVYDDLGDVFPGQWTLDENQSPVLVYNPSLVENDGVVRIGRFFFAYSRRIPKDYKKCISQIVRWVRQHSEPVPTMTTFRMMAGAKKIKLVRQWIGPAKANPLFQKA